MKFNFYLLVISLTFICNAFAESVTIHDTWIKEAPKLAPTSVIFAKLTNNTNKAISLTKVASPISSRIELHRTMHKNGMMKMRKQAYITILANSTIELKPMSWHIMIFAPKMPLRKNRSVKVTFFFSDNSRQSLNVKVK